MKKNIAFIILILFSSIIHAQFRYPKKVDAALVKSKKIAVELLNENDSINITLNKALKDVFTENWNNSTEIEFLSSVKMKEKITAKDNSYTYLFQEKNSTKDYRTKSRTINTGPGFSNKTEIRSRYIAFQFNYYPFSLKRFKDNKLSLITRLCFANADLSKSDYLFLVQQLDRLINYSNNNKSSNDYYGSIEDNATKLKNSELLILKDYFKDKDIAKMDSHYKNKFKIVDLKEQEETILNKPKDKTYLKILWNDYQNAYMWVTIDSETGRVLSQMSFGGIKFGVEHNANEIIKAKHLKYATNKTFQKVNSRDYR